MVKACFCLETNSGSIPPPPSAFTVLVGRRAGAPTADQICPRWQGSYSDRGPGDFDDRKEALLVFSIHSVSSSPFQEGEPTNFNRVPTPFPKETRAPTRHNRNASLKSTSLSKSFSAKKNAGQVILTFLLPPYSQVMEGRAPTAGVNAEATTTEISWMPAARPPDAHLPRAAPTYLDPSPTVRCFLGGLDGGKGVVDGKRPPRSNVLF